MKMPLPYPSSGSVLLMVIITSAILYLVAATLLLLTMTEVHISDYELRSAQALSIAESSITLGLAELRANPDYRTTTSELTTVGQHLGLMNVQYHRRIFHNATSLYHLRLEGTGSIEGLYAATQRVVEQDIHIKPFAIFARNSVTIEDGCKVIGHVHSNGPMILEEGSHVEGNISSSVFVDVPDEAVSSGSISEHEPALAVPELDFSQYHLFYRYQGKQYTAGELAHDTVTLSAAEDNLPPFETLDLYSGYAPASYDPDDPTANPAGIFYTETPLSGEHTALDLEGTLVIPSSYSGETFSFTGPVRITPIGNLPAVISTKDIDVTVQDAEELKNYTTSLKHTHIAGLVYSQGDILMTGDGTTGTVLTGSLLGSKVRLNTNLMLHVEYDNVLFASPPPSIDFIELGAWREPFSQ